MSALDLWEALEAQCPLSDSLIFRFPLLAPAAAQPLPQSSPSSPPLAPYRASVAVATQSPAPVVQPAAPPHRRSPILLPAFVIGAAAVVVLASFLAGRMLNPNRGQAATGLRLRLPPRCLRSWLRSSRPKPLPRPSAQPRPLPLQPRSQLPPELRNRRQRQARPSPPGRRQTLRCPYRSSLRVRSSMYARPRRDLSNHWAAKRRRDGQGDRQKPGRCVVPVRL